MRNAIMIGLAAALAVSCAARTEAPVARPVPPPAVAVTSGGDERSVFRAQSVQVTARVQAIDHTARLVTLRGPEGNVFQVHAGDEVKNLAQVHEGDDVVVTYYEAVAVTVHEPGEKEPMIETSVDVSRAKVGETPGASDVRRTTVVATVVGLNKQDGTLTVKGPRKKVVTVAVQDRSKLEHVKVGDMIQLVYTEALAIGVDKAPVGEGEKKHGTRR